MLWVNVSKKIMFLPIVQKLESDFHLCMISVVIVGNLAFEWQQMRNGMEVEQFSFCLQVMSFQKNTSKGKWLVHAFAWESMSIENRVRRYTFSGNRIQRRSC